ncbi:glycosyltransferase [Nesterenkonia sp. CF4.4]|uniref:glycosyltransferase n=1 Tax=Nesterenkonia sp. CF4.4 TaxID=3373079 RepID=UPI003EE70675
MRIIHVATLVTPDGAYGGPIRVAINQLRELQERGHDVELVASHRGFAGAIPKEEDGVPLRLFPAVQRIPRTGFAGLASPLLQRYLGETATSDDAVHVHLARDLVTMPAARSMRRIARRLVVQTHGMVDVSSNPLAPVFDSLLTRPILRSVDIALSLTENERASLHAIAGSKLRTRSIHNGVPVPSLGATPSTVEVLFLARLHPRKRASLFVKMARALADEFSDVNFALVGPDEGEAGTVSKMIADSGHESRIRWEGALAPDQTSHRMRASSIYVLPSVGEVFPMSVLEAMALGKPVVVTADNGLAEPIAEANAGIVVDDSLEQLSEAVRELLRNAPAREAMGMRARALVQRNYGMNTVADCLEGLYA